MKILGTILPTLLFNTPEPSGAAAAPAPAPAASAPASSAASPAPSAPAAPAAAPPASGNAPADGETLRAALMYDPFAEPTPPKGVGNDPAQPPTALPAAPPAAPPVAPVVAPPAPPDHLSVIAQGVQHLLQTQQQSPPQGQQPSADPMADIDVPGYNFTIPDGMVAALAHEDPAVRKQGIGALIQGTAQNIHRVVFHAARQHIEREVPRMVAHAIQQDREQRVIFDDFYGTHKELNNPALHPLVVNVASQMMRQQGFMGWTPQFRDAVAMQVKGILMASTGASVPGPAPMLPAGSPPALPPSPPVVRPGARTQADHMDIF